MREFERSGMVDTNHFRSSLEYGAVLGLVLLLVGGYRLPQNLSHHDWFLVGVALVCIASGLCLEYLVVSGAWVRLRHSQARKSERSHQPD